MRHHRLRLEPHVFVASKTLVRWDGEPLCAVPKCEMPERNRIHQDAPAADDSNRIIGERGNDADAA